MCCTIHTTACDGCYKIRSCVYLGPGCISFCLQCLEERVRVLREAENKEIVARAPDKAKAIQQRAWQQLYG